MLGIFTSAERSPARRRRPAAGDAQGPPPAAAATARVTVDAIAEKCLRRCTGRKSLQPKRPRPRCALRIGTGLAQGWHAGLVERRGPRAAAGPTSYPGRGRGVSGPQHCPDRSGPAPGRGRSASGGREEPWATRSRDAEPERPWPPRCRADRVAKARKA